MSKAQKVIYGIGVEDVKFLVHETICGRVQLVFEQQGFKLGMKFPLPELVNMVNAIDKHAALNSIEEKGGHNEPL